MSILLYKWFHLLGIFMVFLSVGGMLMHAINGGSKESNAWRKPVAMFHGIGVLLLLVSGFGMLARLEIPFPWPGWVWAKLVIWLVFGGLVALVYRSAPLSKALFVGVLVLGALAACLAIFKPF